MVLRSESRPGGAERNCSFASLSQHGYTSASLARADEKDAPALEYLFGLVYPNREAPVECAAIALE